MGDRTPSFSFFSLPSIQLLGLAPLYHFLQPATFPRPIFQRTQPSLGLSVPASELSGCPRKEAANSGFHLQLMKEAIFSRDKVRGIFRLPCTLSLWSPALSFDQTPCPLPTPQEGHQRVPTEPTKERVLSEQGSFLMGRETMYLFPLESIQVEQCQRLGWGTKGIRQGPQKTVYRILAIRLQNMLLLATAIPTGKCSFWTG